MVNNYKYCSSSYSAIRNVVKSNCDKAETGHGTVYRFILEHRQGFILS